MIKYLYRIKQGDSSEWSDIYSAENDIQAVDRFIPYLPAGIGVVVVERLGLQNTESGSFEFFDPVDITQTYQDAKRNYDILFALHQRDVCEVLVNRLCNVTENSAFEDELVSRFNILYPKEDSLNE